MYQQLADQLREMMNVLKDEEVITVTMGLGAFAVPPGSRPSA
jgi:hypothetical protein